MNVRSFTWTIAIVVVASHNLPSAEPSTKTPFELLKRHATVPEADAVWKQVVAADSAFRENLEKLAQDASPDPRKVSQGSVNLRQLKRWVEWLRNYGEPASIDLSMRLSFYDQTLLKVTQQFWSIPQSGAIRQKVIAGLARSEKQRLQRVAKITDLMQKGDAVAAEKQLDSLLDEIFATAGCLTPEEVRPITEPINQVEGFVRSAMSEVRQNRAREVFTQESQRYVEKYQALVGAVEEAATQVASGTSLLRGEAAVSKVAALGGFLNDWNEAHVGLIRAVALARVQSLAKEDAWTANAAQLSTKMQAAITKFVVADVSKTNSDQASAKYTEILSLLGSLVPRCSSTSFANGLEKPLLQLASKAGMGEQVLNYQEATSDMLRWRARVASAKAKSLAKEYPVASSLAKAKLSATAVGLYDQNQPSFPQVTRPIPDLMPLISTAMLQSSVTLPGLRRLDGKTEIWMSRFAENLYGKIPVNSIRLKSPEALERDLLVDQQHPPLTLSAAIAVALSEEGVFESVGGSIIEITLEGAAARFAKFPVVAGCLIPVGEVQPAGVDPLSALVLRIDIEPKWVQHKYFFEFIRE